MVGGGGDMEMLLFLVFFVDLFVCCCGVFKKLFFLFGWFGFWVVEF